MATNFILPFAGTDTGTNLLTQEQYEGDAQRIIGHQPGVARSKLENKALRQATSMAAGLAQYIADNQTDDVSDSLTAAQVSAMLTSANAATFADNQALTNPGYQILPGGLIIQWGVATHTITPASVDRGEFTFSFPIAFTTSNFGWGAVNCNDLDTINTTAIGDDVSQMRIRWRTLDGSKPNRSTIFFVWFAFGK